jgi:hypothetical protein
VRDAWSAIGERSEIAFRPCHGEILKDSSAGIHHCNHHRSQIGVENERSGHGNERHRIDAHSPRSKIVRHGNAKRGNHGHGSSGPNPTGGGVEALKRGQEARRQCRKCPQDQGTAQESLARDHAAASF